MTLRHALLLGFLMTCGFLVVGQLYLTIPLVNDMAKSYGVSPARATWAGSAFGFAYAGGFLIFGPLSDRYGRGRVLVAGLIATAVTTLLVSQASTFNFLLTTRILQGLAASTFPPAALSLVSETLPPEQRPFGVSLMSFAFLGAAPLAQFIAAQSGASLSILMLEIAPLYVIGATGLFAVAKNSARTASAPTAGPNNQLTSLFHAKSIIIAWMAATTVLFGFVTFHVGAQILGPSAIGAELQMLRLVGLPPLALTFAAAPLTRRCGALTTARIGLGIASLSLILGVTELPAMLIIASILLSAGVALAVPGLIATIAGFANNSNRGLALAIYSFALFVGASLAGPVAQILATYGIVLLWLLPATLLGMAAFALLVTGKPKIRK
ncbi:MFS transporter [Phyllobacterium sp. TAF24]|uniref:MFS transporter n=1 Tax=Phyllobacterium sp. TAF24 TaxID=3233068 RepID=UPI003F980EA9